MEKSLFPFDRLDTLKDREDDILDLTRPMDGSLTLYTEEGYSDPDFTISEWCSVHEKGFMVSKLVMGTQTGTHIDAPAHFLDGGAKMGSLLPRELMGRYFLIDIDSCNFDESIISSYSDEQFLLIKSCKSKAMLSRGFYEYLLSLDAGIWVVAGECGIINEEPFSFNRGLAMAGKFLVEDIDVSAAEKIISGGYIFAMPLKLMDTAGAPCRVVVLQGN